MTIRTEHVKHYVLQKHDYSRYMCGSSEGLQSGKGSAYEWKDVTCTNCLRIGARRD